jgi:hypothetical protein
MMVGCRAVSRKMIPMGTFNPRLSTLRAGPTTMPRARGKPWQINFTSRITSMYCEIRSHPSP